MTGNQELYNHKKPCDDHAETSVNAEHVLGVLPATYQNTDVVDRKNDTSEIDTPGQDTSTPHRNDDLFFMGKALEQARIAASLDEVPIGAVVVKEGRLIASAYNRREIDHDPAGHAEFLALMQASRHLGIWRLSGCTVYVTLEPCLMCAGLMYQARIDRCVFGAFDAKAGALGSLYQINADERLNHVFEVVPGVRQEESAALLKEFFQSKRARNKARKLQARQNSNASKASN